MNSLTKFYQLVSGMWQAMPVTGTNPLPTIGQGFYSPFSITRAATTPSYTAGDVVGVAGGGTAAKELVGIGPVLGGLVMLTSARFEVDLAAVISGMANFRLELYGVTPPSAYADDAAWDLPSGDRASYRGYVDLGTAIDLGSTLYVEATQINKQVYVPAGGSLFAYLRTMGAYTGAASTVFSGELHSVAMSVNV